MAPPAVSAAAAPAPSGGDWRQPTLTIFTAQDLDVSQEEFDSAFSVARRENDRGAPFGGALWGALMSISRNHQTVDELVDELPEEAFGPGASPYFEVIIRSWARAVASETRPEWQTYKSLAMAGGWRPGDANAAWCLEQITHPPALLNRTRHPMGLDLLPAEFPMSRLELAVYTFLSNVLKKPEGERPQ